MGEVGIREFKTNGKWTSVYSSGARGHGKCQRTLSVFASCDGVMFVYVVTMGLGRVWFRKVRALSTMILCPRSSVFATLLGHILSLVKTNKGNIISNGVYRPEGGAPSLYRWSWITDTPLPHGRLLNYKEPWITSPNRKRRTFYLPQELR